MTDYPKVSVVTITYGHEQYITQTLDGVLLQNYPGEIEFIIANDNSPDNTDEVVKSYLLSKNLPTNFSIKYTKHEVNKGMMPNFIWALRQASGKYIALCEGDDYWIDPLKLQKQVDFLEENEEYVLTGHRRIIVDENGTQKKGDMIKDNDYYTQCLVFKNVLKNDFLNYDNSKISNGDTFLILYLNNFGKSIILDFIGSAYRISSSGVWSTVNADRRYKLSKVSLENMLLFFKKYHYFRSSKTVNKYLVDNEIRRFRHIENISYFHILKLIFSCIWLGDLNRFKSVVKLFIL